MPFYKASFYPLYFCLERLWHEYVQRLNKTQPDLSVNTGDILVIEEKNVVTKLFSTVELKPFVLDLSVYYTFYSYCLPSSLGVLKRLSNATAPNLWYFPFFH